MAGPHTDMLCDAVEALKLERSDDQGAPGSGAAYVVTDATIAYLTEAQSSGKKFIVADSGSIEIE